MAEDQGLTMREFGRQVGRSAQWVSVNCKTGKIPRNDDGTIPAKEGLKAAKLLIKATEAKKQKNALKKQMLQEDNDDEPMDEEAMLSAAEVIRRFNQARMEEKMAQAQLRELELQIKQGEVILKTEVDRDGRALGTLMKEFGRSMPSRYAGLLENRSAREIEEVLEDMWSDFLKVLHKSKHTKDDG